MSHDTPIKLARVLDCPQCGGSVTIRTGYSFSAVCGHCHTILDPSDERLSILAAASDPSGRKYPCSLPLGSRGTLHGVLWEIVGFMSRSQRGASYAWAEYLLFNPWRGFAWLVEYNGKWTYTEVVRIADRTAAQTVSYRGTSYTRSDGYVAVVDSVQGEFYWQVKVGDIASVADYESFGASTMTCESTASEVNWSRGRPVTRAKVAKAFGVAIGQLPNHYAAREDSDDYGEGVDWSGQNSSQQFATVAFWVVLCVVVYAIIVMSDGGGSSGGYYSGK